MDNKFREYVLSRYPYLKEHYPCDNNLYIKSICDVKICGEMLILRMWLDDNNIKWEDDTVGGWVTNVQHIPEICRTLITYDNEQFSVIHGEDTIGGFNTKHHVDTGLLELLLPDGTVIGSLTAADVLYRIEHYFDVECLEEEMGSV